MSTGLVKGNSIFGLEAEVTEGTYVAPSGTGKYLQLLEGFDFKPSMEVVDRQLITASPGKETPRLGVRSVSVSMPTEFRADGVEGAYPDFDKLLLGALGAQRQIASSTTTKSAGNTSTVMQIEDADISKFAVGDIVVVKESGDYEARPISATDSTGGAATITFPFALTNGAPSNSVVLSKAATYYTAATGHPSLSVSAYWANQIRSAAFGCKVASMALENFSPGKVANWNFGLEGLGFTEIDGAAPHTPVYDTGTPPIILNACVWRAGVLTPVNGLTLGLTNELGAMTTTCSANGKTGLRVKSREINGTLSPYKDDTLVGYFNDWVAGTEFSLFAYAYNPSSTAGQGTLGSYVALWLPQCFTTEYQTGEVDQVLVDNMTFRATRGANGTSEEMYLGLI